VYGTVESSAAHAEALLALARVDYIRANSAIELVEHQIAALTGRGANSYAKISRPKLDPEAIALPQVLPADLLARRADIQASLARIDAATAGREVARKAFYPDINLVAFAGWSAIDLDSMFKAPARTWAGGAAIHLPIFDAGELRANYASATAFLDSAVADYNGAVLGAVKQTADALTQLRALQDQSVQQRVALDASQESFRLAQILYRNGIWPQLNVLDAETTLLEAETRSATLSADIESHRVALLVAFGVIWPGRPAQENPNESSSAIRAAPRQEPGFVATTRVDPAAAVVVKSVIAWSPYWFLYARFTQRPTTPTWRRRDRIASREPATVLAITPTIAIGAARTGAGRSWPARDCRDAGGRPIWRKPYAAYAHNFEVDEFEARLLMLVCGWRSLGRL
jgi:hypothetical protein